MVKHLGYIYIMKKQSWMKNMRLMKQYCPKHFHFGTARMKPDKRTDVGKQIKEKMGKSTMGPIATS